MNKPRKLQLIVLIIISIGIIFVLMDSCSSADDTPPPDFLDLPGVYQVEGAEEIPWGHVQDWRYDPDQMLLRKPPTSMFSKSKAAFYNWRTGKLQKFTIDWHRSTIVGWDAYWQGPDMKVVLDNSHDIYIYDYVKDKYLFVTGNGYWPSLLSDGNRLAYWQGKDLIILDLQNKNEQTVLQLEGIQERKSDAIWNNTGTKALLMMSISADEAYREKTIIELLDINTKQQIQLFSSNFCSYYFSWSPDGKYFSYLEEKSGEWLNIFDPVNVCEVVSIPLGERISGAYWMPNEHTIAIIYDRSHLYFLDLEEYLGIPYEQMQCAQ